MGIQFLLRHFNFFFTVKSSVIPTFSQPPSSENWWIFFSWVQSTQYEVLQEFWGFEI
jgi:hypothetical protein